MLVEITLGDEALEYIRASLAEGGALSHELLRLPLEQGEVKTWLPATVAAGAARDFADGWSAPSEGGGWRWVAPLVAAYLRQGEDRYCVVETLWGPYDSGLHAHGGRYFVHDAEVCYLLTSASSMDDINRALTWARRYPFVAVLTVFDRRLRGIDAGENIDTSALRGMADGAELLLIGAYDDQGALVWARRPGIPDLQGRHS